MTPQMKGDVTHMFESNREFSYQYSQQSWSGDWHTQDFSLSEESWMNEMIYEFNKCK